MKLIGKWSRQTETKSSRGEVKGFYILMGVFIVLAAVVAFNYYHDRNTDFQVHVPRIEVH